MLMTAHPVPAHVPTGCGPAWPDFAQSEREDRQARAFLAAARSAALADTAHFAPWTDDFRAPRGPAGRLPRRPQTVGEVLTDAMDYASGDALQDALGLLCQAADGRDVRADAAALLGRMAQAWARHNSDEA